MGMSIQWRQRYLIHPISFIVGGTYANEKSSLQHLLLALGRDCYSAAYCHARRSFYQWVVQRYHLDAGSSSWARPCNASNRRASAYRFAADDDTRLGESTARLARLSDLYPLYIHYLRLWLGLQCLFLVLYCSRFTFPLYAGHCSITYQCVCSKPSL